MSRDGDTDLLHVFFFSWNNDVIIDLLALEASACLPNNLLMVKRWHPVQAGLSSLQHSSQVFNPITSHSSGAVLDPHLWRLPQNRELFILSRRKRVETIWASGGAAMTWRRFQRNGQHQCELFGVCTVTSWTIWWKNTKLWLKSLK